MTTSTTWYEPLAGHPLLVKDFKGLIRLASNPRARIALIVEACQIHGSAEEMCQHYDYLTVDEARYVMDYYESHKQELDAEIAEDRRLAEEGRRQWLENGGGDVRRKLMERLEGR